MLRPFSIFLLANCFFAFSAAAAQKALSPYYTVRFPKDILSLDFHPKKEHLLIGTHRDVFLLDLYKKKRRILLRSPFCKTSGWRFSSQGRYLTAENREKCSRPRTSSTPLMKKNGVYVWEMKKKALPLFLGRHAGKLRLLRIGPKEKYLSSVGQDGTVKIWSLSKKKLLHRQRIPKHSRGRLGMVPYELSPSLHTLAIRHWQDYYMLLYRMPFGKRNTKASLLHRTEYPFGKKQPLFCFREDSRAYFDGLRIRRIHDGKILRILRYKETFHPQRALFSPKGNILAIAGKVKVLLYNTKNGAAVAFFRLQKPLAAMAFHSRGTILSIAQTNKKLHFIRIPRFLGNASFRF